jgi:alpha-ketoglutarate-dependent taurine dioxygenase
MDTITTDASAAARARDLALDVWTQSATQLLVASSSATETIFDRPDELRSLANRHLHREGAILFRGFKKGQVADFHSFAASFGQEVLTYEFGSTPRSKVQEGVYSSTEYPAHQWIPQHNEQSYTSRWPMKIWFYCDTAAAAGGDTPIANSREVYRRIPDGIRRRWRDKGLMYVRNYGNGLDVPWEQVFQTSDRAEVEAFCARHQIQCEWRDDGNLRTRQICQSDALHPVTGEAVWFNQAHLFHVSGLEPHVRETLLAAVDDEAELPRNVFHGDGTDIEESVLDEIRDVYADLMLAFRWQEGDILMLDNMLTSHGRAPFTGARRVLVAMAEPFSA